MLNRLFRSNSNIGSRYGLLLALVAALFAIGYLVGNLANMVFQAGTPSSSAGIVQPKSGALVDPPRLLPDFTLTSQTGDPISLSDLRGRAAVLFFGYTHCPDECPTTMANFKRVKQALGDQAGQVSFVFISVDGKRDTPAQLTQFLAQFDPNFIGMTGDEVTLRRMGSAYGLVFAQDSIIAPAASDDQADGQDQALDPQNYFVQHTSPAFLVDREGYLRMVFFYGTEPDTIADGIRQVLKG